MNEEIGQLRLFVPFKPMLCERKFWKDIIKSFKGNHYYIEPKHDGERLMIHYNKINNITDYKLFTRNSNDVTNKWGYLKAIQKYLDKSFENINSCILDGELMSWNKLSGRFAPFGSNRSNAQNENILNNNDNKSIEEQNDDKKIIVDEHIAYVIFDCVYINGVTLINKPLYEHINIIKKHIKPINERIFIIDRKYKKNGSTTDIMQELDYHLIAGHEGIVIKDVNSIYQVGVRTQSGWIKLKPDHIDQYNDTLDVIILGGYYGEGSRRAGTLSHFLCGIKDSNSEHYYTIGKVGSGYTDLELKNINDQIGLSNWLKFDVKRIPSHFIP